MKALPAPHGGLLLICDGGGQIKDTLEKHKNVLNLGHFRCQNIFKPKNIRNLGRFRSHKYTHSFLVYEN